MTIRELRESDFPELRAIHNRYYRDEFDLSDLFDHALEMFVIVDDNDKVICAGGVRAIAETVLITDKSRPVLERKEALTKVLATSEFIAQKAGFEQLHVFVQEPCWLNRLKKVGFKPTVGQALVLFIEA